MPLHRSKAQYVLISLLLAWSAIAQAVISGHLIAAHSRGRNAGVLPLQFHEDSLALRGSPSELQPMGLEPGDELVALEGEIVTGFRQLERMRFTWKPGQHVHVMVRRMRPGQVPQMIMVERTVPVHPPRSAALGWTFTVVLYTIVPIFSLILGFFVVFSRPRDKLAWITLAMLASFSQLGPATFFGLPSPWMQIVVGYRSLLSNTWPLWVMLFGLYFPHPFGFLRKHRWIAPALAVPFIVLLCVDLYTDFYDASRIAVLRTIAHYETRLEGTVLAFFIVCIASFFVSLGIKLRDSRDADARRRLQWLLAGSAVALLPSLLLRFLQTLLGIEMPLWYAASSILAITLFPVTLAYVIVVQRAMEVRVAVRAGVQYAFARGGITVLVVILAAGIILLSLNLVQSSTGLVPPIVLLAVSTGLLVLLIKAGRKLAAWTDRKFFREAYDTEVILTELSQNVAGIRDTKALLETVTRQISDSLHVPRVAVLLKSSDAFHAAYGLGYEKVPAIELPSGATTIQVLESEKKPSTVYFDDETSWVQRTPEEEREILRLLDSQLLLPVTLKERLLGIISLGPKLSEAPYTTADMRLLSAVASQTGLALENARLTESIKREVAERERINRELEIAREVQQRLFPQHLPAVDGLDFAGYCRPQQDVGGDYYDFIPLGDSCLASAIGDVSGKGIAASLMMATLQASLRSQTLRPGESPAGMLELMNKLVYEGSASNRYATFFYGQYSAQSRSMVYVNAGHDAPIVCRKNGGNHQILRLERGGTVLGLFPDVSYQEGCVQLYKGDVVVGFTDGISEAMNAKDEEWGEGRLIDAVCECEGRNASDVISYILRRVDAFTEGARQHDDMTLVVMRVE
jgi:phosphoserine phosphatase RsbU/P